MSTEQTRTIHSYAKINRYLLVWPISANKLHRIHSLFQTISLHDTLSLTKKEKGYFNINCTNSLVPINEDNLLSRVYRKLENKLPFGLDITLKKNIPLGAGLGGGSSNAASLLVWLNQEARLNYSIQDLEAIATKLGSDIPFFITGNCALVEEFGEKITPLATEKKDYFVLINPNQHCNTKKIYAKFDTRPPQPISQQLIDRCIKNKNGPNHLQDSVMSLYPSIHDLFLSIKKLGYPIAMTGSGSCLFIPCNTSLEAQKIEKILKSKWKTLFIQAVHTNPISIAP